MTFPSATVPLFVYGSLRPGMALWGEIRDHVVESLPGSVRGRLLWHSGMEWPLLCTADDDSAGKVVGDLLVLTPGDAVNRVIVDEELRYGYDARWLPVSTAEGEVEAIVLVWHRTTDLGPEITSGDYAVAVAEIRGTNAR